MRTRAGWPTFCSLMSKPGK
uniref:Uncharacterized protein n=1 Tax=Anguilla anguilla TaxID=7936 RepID=A0A0E9XMX6_ANGAN